MANTPGIQEEMYAQISGKQLFEQAQSYAYSYMDGVYDRSVFPADEVIDALGVFDENLPAEPMKASEVLRMLHEHGSPATVAVTGGRYFGFVNGSSIPAALAARWLSDVWDQNTALHVMSPVASRLESICEHWMVDLLGLPAGTAAGLVGGTSAATLCGLAAGRNELLKRHGWDVNADGLFGAPNLRVVLSEQAHASVFKALSLLGLGRARVELVAADEQGRLRTDKLPRLDGDCLVIAQAGNVNSGSFDAIDEICDRASQVQAWVHVDGAFGLWAAASPGRRHLTSGINKADSWSVDAHKTLNAPYDCGIVLCRKREALVAAMQASASYLPQGDQRDGMHYTVDMSRRARAVELWATLKSLGREGTGQLVDQLCDLAIRFSLGLRNEGFRILNEVVFNQVLTACDTPEQTQATLVNLQKSGECWCGGAVWNGEPVIRISVCSWATTKADVDRSVAAFVKARKQIQPSRKN